MYLCWSRIQLLMISLSHFDLTRFDFNDNIHWLITLVWFSSELRAGFIMCQSWRYQFITSHSSYPTQRLEKSSTSFSAAISERVFSIRLYNPNVCRPGDSLKPTAFRKSETHAKLVTTFPLKPAWNFVANKIFSADAI